MAEDQNNDKISFSSNVRKNDGNLEVSIVSDSMMAVATLYPPSGDGAPLLPDYASELMLRMGITEGLLWEELTEAIFTLNTERKIIKNLVVAKGREAQPEYPEHITLEKRFTGGIKINQEAQRVDWRDVSAITLVHKSEKIASVIPKQAGLVGKTVRGEDIPFSKVSHTAYSAGKNILVEDDALYAACDGKLTIDGSKISIDEILTIKGDVDFHVGHISFPGDVIIEGSIGPGFRVYSGGSIVVKETMDAFDIQAKKDIICAMGIIGKSPGHIRCGGRLEAKYIENARLAVRQDVVVSGAIVGSHVYVLGNIRMGDKGRIVGGEIFAKDGIVCGWIGGKTNPVTHVSVGTDFTIQQKLDQASNALQVLSMKYQHLVNAVQAKPEPAVIRLRDETEIKLKALAQGIADLNARVDSNHEAVIEVHGGIYPGVTLSICHTRISIEKEMKKARFRLDPVAGKIIIESK